LSSVAGGAGSVGGGKGEMRLVEVSGPEGKTMRFASGDGSGLSGL